MDLSAKFANWKMPERLLVKTNYQFGMNQSNIDSWIDFRSFLMTWTQDIDFYRKSNRMKILESFEIFGIHWETTHRISIQKWSSFYSIIFP